MSVRAATGASSSESDPGPEPAPAGRTRSMQARLTLLLGAIALLVSSLAGATLFWALKREVARQEITEVTGKFELIEHLVDMQRGARGMDELAAALDNMRAGHGHLGIWIEDSRGRRYMAASRPSSWNGWRATKWSCTRPTARACAACAWRWTSAWRQAPSSPWAWAPARGCSMPTAPRCC